MRKINIYCGFYRSTVVKQVPSIINDIFMQINCLECGGTGVFDCGIEEQRGRCECCKGTGKVYV